MGISVVHWHNDVLVPTYVYYNFSKAKFTVKSQLQAETLIEAEFY